MEARLRGRRSAVLTLATTLMLTASASVLAGGSNKATGAEKRTIGKQAWTRAAVSGGLHGFNLPRTVIHAPAEHSVPVGARITKVYADRDYTGDAQVQTSLCWDGTARCVDIVGRHINTAAFNGLDAGRPMSLVHRLIARNTGPIPLYITSNVTVWFTHPEERSEP